MNRLSNKLYTIVLLAISCLFVMVTVQTGSASSQDEVYFADSYVDNGVVMRLKGTGVKSVFFFKAFEAGYYKQEDGSTNESLGDFSKRIEVQYFVNIPADKLHKFTIDSMKDNVSAEQLKALDKKIALMGKYFVDLKPGDRFALTYTPEAGTEFSYNNQVTGVIEGAEFAKALFSVWLGEKPFDEKLKQQITGGEIEPDRQNVITASLDAKLNGLEAISN